jgi:hypothetical protein
MFLEELVINKKTSKPELPKWFDIKKYKGAKNLDAEGWYVQLATRYSLMCGTAFYGEFLRKDNSIVNYIRENPILDISKPDPVGWRYADMCLPQLYSKDPEDYIGISLPKMEEIVPFYNLMYDERLDRKKKKERGEYLVKKYLVDSTEIHKNIQVPLVALHYQTYPDDVILNDIKRLLDKIRKRSFDKGIPEIKSEKATSFIHWYRSGLLPYIDLEMWREETQQGYKKGAFENSLDELDDIKVVSSGVLKTLESLWCKLMKRRTLSLLLAQAIAEKRGYKKREVYLKIK